jgi:uncharacterized protein (DUF2164 family)
MAIALPRETSQQMVASIRRYFEERLDQEIGEMQAGFLLDFFLKEVGPSVYNLAIQDAQAYFQEKTTDLDGSCYQPELSYWKRR